jgi:hypothetical protein
MEWMWSSGLGRGHQNHRKEWNQEKRTFSIIKQIAHSWEGGRTDCYPEKFIVNRGEALPPSQLCVIYIILYTSENSVRIRFLSCQILFFPRRLDTCLMSISRFSLRDKVALRLLKLHFYGVDVVEWSGALDVRLSDWCCSVSMVWVQIPSREEQNLTAQKSNSNTVFRRI